MSKPVQVWKKYLKLEDLVYTILLHEPKTRESAEELYYCVVEEILGKNEAVWVGIFELKRYVREGRLPTFESVSRCGRKVREKHPSLLTQEQAKRKLKRESDYFKYVKESEEHINEDLTLEEIQDFLSVIEEK